MLKETDKRVVRAFVNERPASSNLLETDGVRLDKIGLGGETVAKWIDGRIAIVSTESVKSDESIIRLIKSVAGPGVVDFSYARKGHRVHEHGAMGRNGSYGENDIVHENGDVWVLRDKKKNHYTVMVAGITHSTSDSAYPLSPDGLSIATARADYLARRKAKQTPMQTNGRGVYHETAAGKHDMVLHQDHRGRWRIDLVTSAGGNHTDVTEHEAGTAGNSGYTTPELAFRSALDIQRKKGIRGKSHVFIADRDGSLSDYEPMETNGGKDGTWAFTETGRVWVPEEQFDRQTLPAGSTIEPLRGYGHTMAVMQGTECLGWIVMDESVARDVNAGNIGYAGNGRATTVDPVAARELDLYIANTWELVGAPNSIGKAIDASMKRKLAAGRYDPALAPKGWQALVDAGAKKYEREFGSDSPIFNAATRRQVAADFARAWEDENGLNQAR